MKKAICLLTVLMLLLCTAPAALAAEYSATVNPASVLLMDADSGEILYAKNSTDTVYPASTTKILTALVVLDRVTDSSELVTVPAAALEGIYEGDDSTLTPMLRADEQISVKDLIYGLMLVSGNDTAATLAHHIAGSEEAFAAMMNEKAAELGMTNSHFTNAHGVQDSNHYSTAEDMAKLCRAAMDNAEFMQIVSCGSYTIPATNKTEARELVNSNRFLCAKDDLPGTAYEYATGMKTGYTPTAGGCLVSTAEKDGVRLMCLVFGDDSDDQQERWFLSRDLFEYGFSLYEPAAETAVLLSATEEPAASSDEKESRDSGRGLWIALALVCGLVCLCSGFVVWLRIENIRRHRQRCRRKGLTPQKADQRPTLLMLLIALICLVGMILCMSRCSRADRPESDEPMAPEEEAVAVMAEKTELFAPEKSAASDPSLWDIQWQTEGFSPRSQSLSFGDGSDYFALPGLAGFRGDNYRSGATYGTADVQQQYISKAWNVSTGSLVTGDGGSAWTGSGWTGQPLIVQWDETTRQNMNLYAEKKAKTGLVEVIYATLDGHIYFLDLDDGSYTRDPIHVGMTFKGSGALDPRGYPLLYVGSGDETVDGKRPRMFIISLIDGSILYEYGWEEEFSLRSDNDRWCAFDSSPLVHAESDTLIWPGESGVLYTIKLNSAYDAQSGTVSVTPDAPVKARYSTGRSGEEEYWYGYECSAVIVDHYIYLSENGGMFFCVDLDTMELVWAQDTKDDSNSSPVYEKISEESSYIYTAPSLHWTAEDGRGSICIYKLDALTGEIVWSRSYDCATVDGASGGVQASPLLGREGTDTEGLIIYPIARTPDTYSGLLVAFDCQNGSEVWRLEMDNYTWSSPAAVYTAAGKTYIVLCDSEGSAHLIEGATGRWLDSTDIEWLVEASPAVYNDTVVVGTRGQKIYGMTVY